MKKKSISVDLQYNECPKSLGNQTTKQYIKINVNINIGSININI
jgi:hypothetical protein